MTYDVIVVGMGPGGSSAAHSLAEGGASVLGIERQAFPRTKPCGGALSVKIDRLLDPDFRPVVEREVYGVRITCNGEAWSSHRSPSPIVYMVMRPSFDLYLLEKARAAGAEIREGESVVSVEEEGAGVVVRTPHQTYRARYLVAADGAASIVARSLRIHRELIKGVAIEAEVMVPSEILADMDEEGWIDFGTVPYGYGWIFPKRDHLSAGVAGWESKVGNIKRVFERFLSSQRLLNKTFDLRKQGYWIPARRGSRGCLSTGRCMFVGDAAGLADPLLGEGIYYAAWSGQVAAECLQESLARGESRISRYDERVDAEIYPEFWPAWRLANFLYRFPSVGLQLLADSEIMEVFFQILRGEEGYGRLWQEAKHRTGVEALGFFGLLSVRGNTVAERYDRIAHRYDSLVRVWRKWAGHSGWEQLEGLISRHVPKGGVVLDAGSGTGQVADSLLRRAEPSRVIGLDLSAGMLDRAQLKIADRRVSWIRGDLNHLPLADRSVDVVVSAWALEHLDDPKAGVREFLRVIKDDGFVIYAFSSIPAELKGRYYALLLNHLAKWPFIPSSERPFHDCPHSQIVSFWHGLMTVVVLRKCCNVDDQTAPCAMKVGQLEKVEKETQRTARTREEGILQPTGAAP
ncbi:MAG: geranylgeranyl reductase family protein [Nitrospinota bacterium]